MGAGCFAYGIYLKFRLRHRLRVWCAKFELGIVAILKVARSLLINELRYAAVCVKAVPQLKFTKRVFKEAR